MRKHCSKNKLFESLFEWAAIDRQCVQPGLMLGLVGSP